MNEPDEAILDALYQGAFDIAAFEQAVILIASKFGCRSGAMVSIDAQAPATGAILVFGIFKTEIDRYLRMVHGNTASDAPHATTS